ncbi:DNA repair protein [Tateyamaria omphalii]|uniref:DNA repair protein n=1 Tax=Tateyamaria omphalii TaxID=299262 RepID=A0A1P8N0C9_9RHOB|nr:DNA repair protein [Tateyamaria omphalii]APX13774.1 DNA repair protein [Tateyamaria omphalii]
MMRRLALILFAGLALVLVVATGLAIAGVWPWIDLPVMWDGVHVAQAGMLTQIGLTIFAVSLCFFLPTNARILQLENSHRQFSVGVDDITRAYHAAHHADRDGVFTLGDAFESTRDRLAHLRDHPDLGTLEPELLELAAKMSHISRDLAETYSTEKVERARSFLTQRQFEIAQFNDRLEQAKAIHGEFSTWINRLDLEENVARAQLERLLDEMERLLPELNQPAKPSKVTQLPMRVE